MTIYCAINREKGESYFTTSASDLSGFVGCSAEYLREKLRRSETARVKGFICAKGDLNRISGRGGFMQDNFKH